MSRRQQKHPAHVELTDEERKRQRRHATERRRALHDESKRGARLGISSNDDAAKWLAENDPEC